MAAGCSRCLSAQKLFPAPPVDLQAFQCQTGYNISPESVGSIRISSPDARKTSVGTEFLAGCPNICWLAIVPTSTLVPSQGLHCISHSRIHRFSITCEQNSIIFNFLCITLQRNGKISTQILLMLQFTKNTQIWSKPARCLSDSRNLILRLTLSLPQEPLEGQGSYVQHLSRSCPVHVQTCRTKHEGGPHRAVRFC